MQKFLRNLNRGWSGGIKKSMRMMHIFFPLVLFFAIMITASSVVLFGYALANNLVENLNNKLNVVVYFDGRTSQNYIDDIIKKIQDLPDVSQTEYISAQQALDAFKVRHANDELALRALAETGTNPFGPSIVIFSKKPESYKIINDDIKKMNDAYKDESVKPVEYISYENHEVAINKFSNMLAKGRIIFGVLIIVVSLILLFVSYIALRFATQGDRDEIKVMKLVGASNVLIMGPTAVMGMMAGLSGAIVSLILLYILGIELSPYTVAFSGFNMLSWYTRNIQYFIIGNIFFGMFIGFMGSIFAIKRHL